MVRTERDGVDKGAELRSGRIGGLECNPYIASEDMIMGEVHKRFEAGRLRPGDSIPSAVCIFDATPVGANVIAGSCQASEASMLDAFGVYL